MTILRGQKKNDQERYASFFLGPCLQGLQKNYWQKVEMITEAYPYPMFLVKKTPMV